MIVIILLAVWIFGYWFVVALGFHQVGLSPLSVLYPSELSQNATLIWVTGIVSLIVVDVLSTLRDGIAPTAAPKPAPPKPTMRYVLYRPLSIIELGDTIQLPWHLCATATLDTNIRVGDALTLEGKDDKHRPKNIACTVAAIQTVTPIQDAETDSGRRLTLKLSDPATFHLLINAKGWFSQE